MLVEYDGERFVLKCEYADRQKAKRAGFHWDARLKKWVTLERRIAGRLRAHCNAQALKEIEKTSVGLAPWSAPILYPKHLVPRNFQLEAARFALSRKKSYLALDPGLGKTVVAAMIFNTLKKKMVYICPPFLVANVAAEFTKWCPEIKVMASVKHFSPEAELFIVADSVLHSAKAVENLKEFVGGRADVVLVIDETHRFKNETARRTKFVWKKYVPLFQRVVAMSGTPMPNSPVELFGVLDTLAPETIGFMSKFRYGLRYCAAFEGAWGWDYSGASNLVELNKKIIPRFMLRMRKREVLKELPGKTEELVFIGDNLPPTLGAADKEILRHHSPTDLMKGVIADNEDTIEEALPIPSYRRLLGVAKINAALPFLNYLLEETPENILLFAIHKEVISQIAHALIKYQPLVVTGDTKMAHRQERVDKFQAGGTRLFIGNVQALGTGFTLTRASRVVFLEFPWVPAEIEQASDRTHRIGQHNPVIVQYLVYKNSIDRHVMETIFKKREVTKHV